MVMENISLPLSSTNNNFKFITTQSVDRQRLVDLVAVIVNILDNVVVVVVGVVVGKMKKTSSILRRISFRNGKQDDDAKKESGI